MTFMIVRCRNSSILSLVIVNLSLRLIYKLGFVTGVCVAEKTASQGLALPEVSGSTGGLRTCPPAATDEGPARGPL